MLPHHDLSVHYDDVVWLYVCRTWDEDEKDLEAARIHDRFGVTSWPHLFVIDPGDDRVLERAGRSTAAIRSALEKAVASVEMLGDKDLEWELALLADRPDGEELSLDDRLADPSSHTRVLAIEELTRLGREGSTPERHAALLAELGDPEEDVLVRYRALAYFLEQDANAVRPHAHELLLTPHDPIRFALLDDMVRAPWRDYTPILARLFAEAGTTISSGNPNVLRMRAAKALAVCGDDRAIEALQPVARAADARNGTTRAAVEALGAIGERSVGMAQARVRAILLASYPAAAIGVADEKPSREERYALRLAEAVTAALKRATPALYHRPFPAVPERWRTEDRNVLRKALALPMAPGAAVPGRLAPVADDDPYADVLTQGRANAAKAFPEGVVPRLGPWRRVEGEAIGRLFPRVHFYALSWDEARGESPPEGTFVDVGAGLLYTVAVDEFNVISTFGGRGEHVAFGMLLAKKGVRLETEADAALVWQAFCEVHRQPWLDREPVRVDRRTWHLGVTTVEGVRYAYRVWLKADGTASSGRLLTE